MAVKQEAAGQPQAIAAAPAALAAAAMLQQGGQVQGQVPLQVAQLQAMMQAAAAQQLPFLQAAAAAQQLPFLQLAAAQQLPFLQAAAAAARLPIAQPVAAADSGSEDDSWWEEQARLAAYQVPPDPEQQPRWEVAATTLEEFEVRGRWPCWARRQEGGTCRWQVCRRCSQVHARCDATLRPNAACTVPHAAGARQQVCSQRACRGAGAGSEAERPGEALRWPG